MVKATISRCCPFKNLLLRSFAIIDEWIPGELVVSGFQLLFVLLTEHKCANVDRGFSDKFEKLITMLANGNYRDISKVGV